MLWSRTINFGQNLTRLSSTVFWTNWIPLLNDKMWCIDRLEMAYVLHKHKTRQKVTSLVVQYLSSFNRLFRPFVWNEDHYHIFFQEIYICFFYCGSTLLIKLIIHLYIFWTRYPWNIFTLFNVRAIITTLLKAIFAIQRDREFEFVFVLLFLPWQKCQFCKKQFTLQCNLITWFKSYDFLPRVERMSPTRGCYGCHNCQARRV